MEEITWTKIINDLIQGLTPVIELLIIGVVTLIAAKLNKYISSKTDAAQREILEAIVKNAVIFAEQTQAGAEAGAKLQIAKDMIDQQMALYHIPLTSDKLIADIEAAVNQHTSTKVNRGVSQ